LTYTNQIYDDNHKVLIIKVTVGFIAFISF